MSELQGHPGGLPREEGLARLVELWGPLEPVSREQLLAAAWSRRALGLHPEPGDAELLTEVDKRLAAKYGLRRAS